MPHMEESEFEVHVTHVSGGEVANFLRGYLIFKGERLNFTGVAYGRVGGQNVSPRLSRKTLKRLKELGVDVDQFVLILQRKLVEGDVIIEAKPPEPPPLL